MSDDLLARATRALRDETQGDDAAARFTRSRIMASLHEDRVKRRTRWAFLIPIAATFVAASAFGAASGTAHRAFEVVVRALGIHKSAPTPPHASAPRFSNSASVALQPASTAAPALDAAAPVVDEPAPAAPPAVAEPAPSAPIAAVQPPPSKTQAAPPTGSEAAPAASAPDPTFELYKAAHQAHFVDREWARALSGWDTYLKAAPRGALAPEARYNRALCLLRLHRNEEARAALRPFAEGRYGTYRREEAQKLIEALPAGIDGP
jgi:hypothetical protein